MKIKNKYPKQIQTVHKLIDLAESTSSPNEQEAAKDKAIEILTKIKKQELSR